MGFSENYSIVYSREELVVSKVLITEGIVNDAFTGRFYRDHGQNYD